MKCIICKDGSTSFGAATVILNRGETAVIFRKVPAEICQNCGEYYLSQKVAKQIFRKAEEAAAKGIEVEISRYAA